MAGPGGDPGDTETSFAPMAQLAGEDRMDRGHTSLSRVQRRDGQVAVTPPGAEPLAGRRETDQSDGQVSLVAVTTRREGFEATSGMYRVDNDKS